MTVGQCSFLEGPNSNHNNRILIGVDAGVVTGIAFYEPDLKTFLYLGTMDFWGTMLMFQTIIDHHSYRGIEIHPANVVVLVEDPGQLKFMYRKARYVKAIRRETIEKLAFNVGQNCKEAELLITGANRLGLKVLAIKPTQSKLSKTGFFQTTGYEGKTNQHVRDAGMLVYGYSWNQAISWINAQSVIPSQT